MKNIKTILVLLIPAMLLFSGCPSGVNFSAVGSNTEKIDSRLIGDWSTTDYPSNFKKMKIVAKGNYSFTITVGEVSDDYEEKTKGYTVQPTTISGEKFLSAKPNSPNSTTNYIYHYEFVDGNLVMYNIAFNAKAKKKATSTETLRKVIEEKIKNKDYKRGKVVWKKK